MRLSAVFSTLLLVSICCAGCASPAGEVKTAGNSGVGENDAFVLISGGGSPTSNQYSQYLQAKALTSFLQDRYPPKQVWVFFGMGHRPGVPAELADVHRKYKQDGLLLSTWLVGELPEGRPANRAEILTAFRREILPRVAKGGTLYLFVGDHGELVPSGEKESAITLWQLEHTANGGWKSNDQEVLTVSDLRDVLREGLGRGRVVFTMTQCHSGGFHFMGVPRKITGDPRWYRSGEISADAADWAASLGDPRIAGFTATEEAALAAGCSPDPDPDRWAGYERFVPEALVGADLMTNAARPTRARSFAEAHAAATLVDRTIDLPRSSSDQYLERWADWIERALENPADLDPGIVRNLGIYTQVMDGVGTKEIKDPLFQERQALFGRFREALVAQNPATVKLLQGGTKAELLAALGSDASRPGRPRGNRGGSSSVPKKTWTDTLRPAWSDAVNAGKIKDVSPQALAFEKFLLKLEAKGGDFSSAGQNPALLNWTYWQSSLAFPQKRDQAKADAVTHWSVERRWRIGEWAKGSPDEAVRKAGLEWAPKSRPGLPVYVPPRTDRVNKTALERELLYRRVLGAWAFLLAADETEALNRLRDFIVTENVKLP